MKPCATGAFPAHASNLFPLSRLPNKLVVSHDIIINFQARARICRCSPLPALKEHADPTCTAACRNEAFGAVNLVNQVADALVTGPLG